MLKPADALFDRVQTIVWLKDLLTRRFDFRNTADVDLHPYIEEGTARPPSGSHHQISLRPIRGQDANNG
jgi:hypothetical protein